MARLPIRYYETSMMAAAFTASTRRLRALTPAPLEIVELWPGRSPVAFACFEYTQCDLAPYGEVAISWPVVFGRSAPPLLPLLVERRWPGLGWWVHRLPVTTEEACDAGRTLWGYPKLVADIAYEWRGSRRGCLLAAGGEDILELSIETRLPARPMRGGLTTYSTLSGDLLRTTVEIDAVGITRMRGDAVLHLGPHPIGRELAELDLRLGAPVQIRWYPTWRAVLPEAEWRVHIDSAGAAETAPRAA